MNRKKKGTDAERDLLRKFWENGWAALRTPGSGSAQHPSPDIIAGKQERKIALECKVTKSNSKYFENAEIAQLLLFSEIFGAEPWVGVKLGKEQWFFLNIEDLKKTDKSYVATLENAKNKGLIFEELLGDFKG